MANATVPQNTLRIRQASCLNCDVTLVGDFCHRCGQPASTPAKITLGQMLLEIPRAAWDFERALPNTIIGLLVRPGALIRDFISGRRSKIYSPLALLFILSGFLGVATSTWHLHQVASANDASGNDITEKLFAYYSWVVVACVPVQAIGPTLILRKRLGLGYGEQLMVATMAAAGTAALGLLLAPFEHLSNTYGHLDWAVQLGGSGLKLFYLVWVYAGIQKDGREEWSGKRWLRAIASVITSLFSLIVMICVVATVAIVGTMLFTHVKEAGFSVR